MKKWVRADLEKLQHNRSLVLELYDELSERIDENHEKFLRYEAEKQNLTEELARLKGKKDHNGAS